MLVIVSPVSAFRISRALESLRETAIYIEGDIGIADIIPGHRVGWVTYGNVGDSQSGVRIQDKQSVGVVEGDRDLHRRRYRHCRHYPRPPRGLGYLRECW